ncbi:MAG: transposase [Acidimicrobiia bacterium]|nr:transposase [Acidimicrobiia bacterium]
MLADCLRSDGHRWRTLQPDTPPTMTGCAPPATTCVATQPTSTPTSPPPHRHHGTEAAARVSVTLAYLDVIEAIIKQTTTLEHHIATFLDQHPDAHIFKSLPWCGTIRAATLLVEIGDCRARFPDADSLACLAGVAHPPEHRAATRRSPSAGRATPDSATPSAHSPATPATATNGPPTATANSAPPANATPTSNASPPAPGPRSSGAAGKTTPLRPHPPRRSPQAPTGDNLT